jgi:hypothetical protein
MVTVKISQKHVERFVFVIIILILLTILINEKLPNYLINQSFDSNNETNFEGNLIENQETNISNEDSFVSETTTTTTTSTTTTTLLRDLIFTVDNINHEKIDANRGKINSFTITIKNGLPSDANIILKYYIYDDLSPEIEKITPKKPDVEIGLIGSNRQLTKVGNIERFVFDIDKEKTLKLEIEDLNSGIKKTSIKKINFN